MQTGFAFTKFADRLSSIAELADEDLGLLAKMPCSVAHYAAHDDILRKHDRPSSCCLVLQGYLCWKDSMSGQITSIHVPGDIPDLHGLQGQRLQSDLSALVTAVVAFVPHSFFHEIAARSLGMSRALALLALADAAALRNWIVNLGSRDSLSRVSHLICEIVFRLRAVGQARDLRFQSPFTQSDLAAACGISTVHANRIIQELRRKQVLQWQSRTITINDWRSLVHVAGFAPDYLCLREPHAVEPQPQQPFTQSTTHQPILRLPVMQ